MSDEQLRARLRDADPARSVAPADPDRLDRLMEDAMRDDDTPTESRQTGTRGRSRLTWVVAAAAVVLMGLAATYAVIRETRSSAPTADDVVDSLVLALPAEAAAGRCMMPTPAALGGAEVAFAGEVVSVSGGRVTLRPTRFYAGRPVDRVEVAQASRSRQALILGVRFEEGGRYLVAANGGDVMVCGFSGAHDEQLARLYGRAFGESE